MKIYKLTMKPDMLYELKVDALMKGQKMGVRDCRLRNEDATVFVENNEDGQH